MRYSELKKCPGCGAPLTPPPNPHVPHLMTCRFCQAQISLEPDLPPPQPHMQPPVAPFPPLGQLPMPQAFTPRVVVHGPNLARILLSILLPFVIAIGALLVAVIIPAIGARRSSSTPAAIAPQRFPLICGLNASITIEGKTVNLADTLIDARSNCKLKIKNSRLTGTTIIKAAHNVEIELEGSSLEATSTAIATGFNSKLKLVGSNVKSGGTAIDANANPKLDISGQSTISGKDRGMKLGSNAELGLVKSTVEGGALGIEAETNAKLRLTEGSVVKGGMHGVKGNINTEVAVGPNCRIESEGTAIEGGTNSKLSVQNGTLTGKVAWDVGVNGRVQLSGAKVTGARKQGTNAKVEEH